MASASRTLILALAGVFTPLVAAGQGASELRGIVVSETGVAIAGATINLSSIGYSIRTDSSGAFVLTGTPGSTLVFTMRAAGCQVSAMEVYPRGVGAPPQYQPQNGSCGVVLIWSK